MLFHKYQANGNDFILIDAQKESLPAEKEVFVRSLCHRQLGVGADGILLIRQIEGLSFSMQIFNADGHEATMCGNGLLICMEYIAHAIPVGEKKISIQTRAGVYLLTKKGERTEIELRATQPSAVDVTCAGMQVEAFVLNTGTFHLVLLATDPQQLYSWESSARLLRYDPSISQEGVNVSILHLLSHKQMLVRVFEKGIEGETLSCGTAAVACAIVAQQKARIEKEVDIAFISGQKLSVRLDPNKRDEAVLIGKAYCIFEGNARLCNMMV